MKPTELAMCAPPLTTSFPSGTTCASKLSIVRSTRHTADCKIPSSSSIMLRTHRRNAEALKGGTQILNSQLGYALDASARNGARLWSKTQPQRVADAKDVGTTPRAAAGAPHTAALRLANLRQVHSPNIKCAHQSARSF